jgi:chromosome segregation ATPase
MQENIKLKTQLNKMETEKINNRREITNLENEINQKDKIIENMINETQSNTNQSNKVSEMHLVLNVKRQYKELKKAYEKNQQELIQAKKNTKITKINELTTENKIYNEQIDKLKNLYNHSREQKQSLKKNVNDFDVMKQALSQKDYIILNFQESCQKMESEIQLLNAEKEKLKNQNNKKEEMINKIKDKLDNQSKENEKLIMTHNNIKKSETYLKAKNKYEAKIQKLKKDIAYYRDMNSKNERILREHEKIKQNPQKKQISRKIFSSNPQPTYDISPIPHSYDINLN